MRTQIAKFAAAVIAVSAIAAGCNDQVTNPGQTAQAIPVDTLLAVSPVDTFFSAPRPPVDTLYGAAPVDTLY